MSDVREMSTGDLTTELHRLIWSGNLFSQSDNDRYRDVRAEYDRRKAAAQAPLTQPTKAGD